MTFHYVKRVNFLSSIPPDLNVLECLGFSFFLKKIGFLNSCSVMFFVINPDAKQCCGCQDT
jgi:hypothetical protein